MAGAAGKGGRNSPIISPEGWRGEHVVGVAGWPVLPSLDATV